MIEFLSQNWQFVIAVGAGIVEFILYLVFKRRPQIFDPSIMARLTEWILEAENIYKDGIDKKDYVLQKAKDYLGSKFVKGDVSKLIEYLLTLPQKK